jgi:hypothetical protein
MSFLDSLEDSVKAMESRAEADPEEARKRQAARLAEKNAALAAQPAADELKSGKFTPELLNHCAVIGHGLRTKVQITWVGTTLRLQAKERKLELRPTPEGIVAVFFQDDREIKSQPLDLKTDPEEFAKLWLLQ